MDAVAGKNIYQRLHAVMGEIDYIQKEKKQGMRYSIVSHDKVTALVRPALHKHGVVYRILELTHGQDGNRTWVKTVVRFTNVDTPSEFVDAESLGYGVDDQDKGPGKAMSYAVKYALLKTLGLETGDEPDEVQDERANHVPEVKTGIHPGDFKRQPGESSMAQSKKDLAILKEEMKAKKTQAEVVKFWSDNAESIKTLHADARWNLFEEMIQFGTDKCQRKLEVELFWSAHQNALNTLKKANHVRAEQLEEYMMTKVNRLGGELINAG
jgi:hypothetical protein